MTQPIDLDSPVRQLNGVGDAVDKKLANLNIKTVSDLINFLPFRLEDHSQISQISQLSVGEDRVIKVDVGRVFARPSSRGILMIQAQVEDKSGKIPAIWFNQRYLLKILRPGRQLLLFGTKKVAPKLGNPFFVKKIINQLEMMPVYSLTAGLTQYNLRRLLEQARPLIKQQVDLLPLPVLEKFNLPDRQTVLEECHFQTTGMALEKAHQYLALEELFLLCLEVISGKQDRHRLKATPMKLNSQKAREVVALFPFALTDSQKRAAWEIIQDLEKPYPMNRLLYGEVGSGKTAVALLLASLVIEQGYQVIWLNPTTTLASQNAQVAKKILAKLKLKVALVTGAVKEDAALADLVVGTHALLHSKVPMKKVGLVVIDEQQRFGVEQRQKILGAHKGSNLLMMTATPIPRSMAQIVFGHLDISFLRGRLAHQKPVETIVFNAKSRIKIEKEIEKRIQRHEPGYVICPLINDPEQSETLFTLERKAVTSELTRLKKRFPDFKIEMMHGKLKSAEKEQIMTKFRSGKIDILLATSLVEVGIDNPQATWMLIEEADWFGLSQLHQLRGRIGRGEKASVCYLSSATNSTLAHGRLKVLTEMTDGLEIAEKDLELRGPGELTGYGQSGLPPLRYANFQDKELLNVAFKLAEKIIDAGIEKYPNIVKALDRRVKQDVDSPVA